MRSAFFVSLAFVTVLGCGGSTTDGGLLGPAGGGAGGASAATGGTSATGGGTNAGGDAGTTAAGTGGAATAGTGGAASGGKGGNSAGGMSAGGANSMACNECIAGVCGTQLTDCANDPQCATCAQPGASLSCFSNQRLDKLLACSCQACAAKCPSIDCKAFPCLECTAKQCPKEVAACEADADCPACLQKNPPDTCKSNAPAVSLYACDVKHCAGPCGL